MQLKKGQVVELDIHALAFGGAGIGKYEGLTVFVEKTMPGDRVKASFFKIKKHYAHADLVEIIKESPDRIKPKCPYSGICGGCQLQFMPYEKQLEFKKQHVIDSFERIGKIYDPPVEDVIPCEDVFYYRNKLEFSFGYDADMNFTLGYHVPGRRFDIMDIKECHLMSPFASEIANAVRDFMKRKKWPPFKYSCGEGFLKALFLREGKNTGEFMVNLATSDDTPEDFDESMEEFVSMLLALPGSPGITSIYRSKIISKRGQPRRTEETLLHGKPVLTETLKTKNGDNLVFDIPPQAFFQVNTVQAEVLYNEILKIVEDKSPDLVFDLFCGTGSIAMFIAKSVERVTGVELNKDSVKIASANATKNGIFNMDFFQGDVNKMISTLKERPSLVVVDPPRAGLAKKFIKQLSEFDSPVIVYVSCNPSTLARDCEELKEYGYAVKKIQPVDMFPHTFHIENVCLLERDNLL